MALPIDIETVVPALLAEGLDGIGERLVRFFLSVFESAADRSPFISLVRSAVTHEESARMFREFITEQLVGRIAAGLGRSNARLRATFVGSQMAGLVLVRYVIRVEPLASADPEVVVAVLAPTIQRYLTGDLGPALG
jgi:predicted RNA-binding Zn ribbon-like protein